jgi:DNA polymerase III alpha subunit
MDGPAEKAAAGYASAFGQDNFYLELQDHGLAQQQVVHPIIGIIAKTETMITKGMPNPKAMRTSIRVCNSNRQPARKRDSAELMKMDLILTRCSITVLPNYTSKSVDVQITR